MTVTRRVLARLAPWLLLGACATSPLAAPAADAAAPGVRLEILAPPELYTLLRTHLDLARLAVLAPGEVIGDDELERLLAATPAQVRSLLQTEGYFEPRVTLRREPVALDAPPHVVVEVDPGARVRVQRVQVDVEGELAARVAAGERAAQITLGAVRDGWAAPASQPFRNPLWSMAKSGVLARLRADGHLGAHWRHTEALIDVDAGTAELTAIADSGPLFRIGELRIEGLQRYPDRPVRNLAGFLPGAVATEQRLIDYRERLLASGLFDAATVTVEPDWALAAAAPLTVRLRERPLQELTAGVGYSTHLGPRGSLQYTDRRAFGHDLIGRGAIELALRRQALDGELRGYPGPGFWSLLGGGAYTREVTDTDVTTSWRARLGRSQESRRLDRQTFAEIERATFRNTLLPRTDPQASRTATAVSVNHHLIWRDLDHVILPTRGHALSLQAGLGRADSADGAGAYARLLGRYTLFQPLGRDWFGQARVEFGQVLRANGVLVPDTLRFRAGGQDSVRGYEHRSLGPVVDGAVTGGHLLWTASVEIARPLSARMPELWGAVFVDAGRAADAWAELHPAVGAGVGLRWRSPVGPLAFDVAYGDEVGRWRTHLSVGVVF